MAYNQNQNPFWTPKDTQGNTPQVAGIQAPNVPMQDKPGMMETMAPQVFQHLVPDDAVGSAFDWMKGVGSDIKESFMPSPSVTPADATNLMMKSAAAPAVQTVAAPFNAASTVGAALSPAASAPILEAFGGVGPSVASQLAAGTSAAAAAAPAAGKGAAALLGPIGIPLAMLAMSQ